MTGGPVGQLALALDLTGGLIDGIAAEGQWDMPTRCPGWTVAEMVTHLADGNYVFVAILHGTPLEQARSAAEAVAPGDDLVARYRDSGAQLVDAFSQPGVLEQVVTIPPGTMPGIGALHIRTVEALVHGWDLAQATGRSAPFPDDLAEQELAFTRRALDGLSAGSRAFGPPQPVPDDAPGIVKLAACLGRPAPA
ncbi:MAG TPA: TIGR03086 family metal-binding protein [Streptosporangiaceae bacterium]